MSIEPGQTAPDFTLVDDEGQEVTLSSFRGEKSVTLVFYPFAFSGVCGGELCELRDNANSFISADNQVLGISCDRKHALAAWKAAEGFGFPLLSDGWPHGEVAKAYGCFNEALGVAERLTVFIGKDGVVTDVFRSGALGEARPFESYTEALSHV